MALFILSLRNGVIQRCHVNRDLDMEMIARELTTIVAAATQRPRE